MKKALLVVLLMGCGVLAHANGGGHYSPAPVVGPQGPIGPRGAPGRDGDDFNEQTEFIGGVSIRLLDYEHMDFSIFDDYDLRAGRNDSVGMRVGFKLGKSYYDVERQRDRQRFINLARKVFEDRYYMHPPGLHQENAYPTEIKERIHKGDKQSFDDFVKEIELAE